MLPTLESDFKTEPRTKIFAANLKGRQRQLNVAFKKRDRPAIDPTTNTNNKKNTTKNTKKYYYYQATEICNFQCASIDFIISNKKQREKCKSISIDDDQKLCVSKPI